MKEKILYKSNSFSINVFTFFFGFIFFGLMFWLTSSSLPTTNQNDMVAKLIIEIIFATGALGSLFYFLKTQTIKITEDYLKISYLFLPISKKILLEDIVGFSQISKPVKYSKGLFDKQKTIHNIFETKIILKENIIVKTMSIDNFELKEVQKIIEKIKRGESKFTSRNLNFVEFVFQNITMVLFLIICLVLIIGLSNALINKS